MCVYARHRSDLCSVIHQIKMAGQKNIKDEVIENTHKKKKRNKEEKKDVKLNTDCGKSLEI